MKTELYELNEVEIKLIMDYRDSSNETQEAVAGLLDNAAKRNRKKRGFPFAGMSRVSKTLDKTLDGQ